MLRVDAVADGRELTNSGSARSSSGTAPFGLGNPNVTLLAVGCERLGAQRGGGGKHLQARGDGERRPLGRHRLRAGDTPGHPSPRGLYDVAFKLAANHWNGTFSPQLVVRRIFETPEGYEDLRRALAAVEGRPDQWSPQARAIFGELELLEQPSGWQPLVESATTSSTLRDRLPLAALAGRLAPGPGLQSELWRRRPHRILEGAIGSSSTSCWPRSRRTTRTSIATCSSARTSSPARRTSTSSGAAARRSSTTRSASPRILAGLRQDDATIAAALLDVVEDTDTTVEVVREEFGEEVARLVEEA